MDWEINFKVNMEVKVFLFLFILLLPVSPCPSDCACKWKGGKITVECVAKALRTFPPTIDPGTQVLDLSGNAFETLPPDHFMRSGLLNLQKIFLSKCRLSHINSRAFRDLSNLVELDLSHNLLRDVPTSAFPDCQGLMRLVLSGNPISAIGKRAFVALEALTLLELSHVGVEIIEYGAFEGLSSLEWLKLDGNRLKRLGGLSLLPLGLKGIALEDNPWECDCHLLELRTWLGDRNIAQAEQPRCLRPERVANHTISSLSLDQVACLPQITPLTMFQKIGEGRNVSLLCKVVSVPESSVEWLFNGQPLSNASLNLLVETSAAYPVTASSSSSATSYFDRSTPVPIEKKSELLILNATAEENGTFLCVARNSAGTATANFTLRVITRYDYVDGPETIMAALPDLVTSYPNLFIILLSTIAVIGLVIVICSLTLVLCKCSSYCRRRTRKRHGGGSGDNNKGVSTPGEDGTMSSGLSVCGLSDGGHTMSKKSQNGSVFLLSPTNTDSNSNPDLIEGVKRVDGDGLDSTSIMSLNRSPYSSEPLYYSSNPQQNSQQWVPVVQVQSKVPHQQMSLNNGQCQYHEVSHHLPMDYGLPFQVPVPPNYDLSKYPLPQQSFEFYEQIPVVQVPPGVPIIPVPQGYKSSSSSIYFHQDFGGGPPNCSCGPILEGNEENETEENVECPATTSKPNNKPSVSVSTSTSSPKSVGDNRGNKKVPTTNESPDEGYEEPEGTEI